MRYNEEVVLDIGMTLEDDYVLSKIEDMQNTTSVKDGDRGSFSFNLTELFKKCPMVFKQPKGDESREEIEKIYTTNKKKLQRMLKGSMGKAVSRYETKRTKSGKKESYFKFNKTTMTVLKNGYPVKVDKEFTEKEKMVMDVLGIDKLSKGVTTQINGLDEQLLKEALEVTKECGILEFAYVRGVYNNLKLDKEKASDEPTSNANKNNKTHDLIDINIISQKNNIDTHNYKKNNKNFKTRFHNINQTFNKYTPEELEKVLKESQKGKFNEYTEESTDKCIRNKEDLIWY